MPPRTLEAVSACMKSRPELPNSKSLRATIPAIVVTLLELKPKDRIRWSVNLQTGTVLIRKEPASR